MKRVFVAVAWASAVAALTFSGFACSSEQPVAAGSQTNWLRCADDQGCPSDQPCECGLCVPSCETADDCGGAQSSTGCETRAALSNVCAQPPRAARICVGSCVRDSDCVAESSNPLNPSPQMHASPLQCRDGYCLPAPDLEPAPTEFSVSITADNAYGFGYGPADGLRTYFGGVGAFLAEDIFHCERGPELYTVPVAELQSSDYWYVVAWADAATTQGVLGHFLRGAAGTYSGDDGWTVCATGEHFEPGSGGPDTATVDRHIGLCNRGDTDPLRTSAGWVDSQGNGSGALAVGEDNQTGRGPQPVSGNEFPLACGVDGAAKWMWFNWDPQAISWPSQTPFIWPAGQTAADNPSRQFLIFRIAIFGPSGG